MACKNCFENCPGGPVSDQCVKYTGEDIPLLGVCKGDTVSEVERIIIEKLLTYTNGAGIILSDITVNCTFLTDILAGKSQTLTNLVQLLLDANCSLRELVTTIETVVNQSIAFDTSCLTLAVNPTKDQILQAVINEVCSIEGRVEVIEGDYVKTSDVTVLIQQYIDSQTVTQEYVKLPKYVALPYHGPLSVFDSNGKGISALGYDKVYLCIGQTVNGFKLPDYRGRSPIGTNVNIPTSGMDSAVNPAISGNAAYAVSLNSKSGEYTHTNTVPEIPSHSHSTSPYNFTVRLPGQRGGDNNDNGNTTAFAGGDKGADETSFNFTISLPVTVPANSTGAAGGNQPHNNLAPVVGANFYMHIP